MLKGETVLSGAPHPGTKLEVMYSPAGWYLGFRDANGAPYSRESHYFKAELFAKKALEQLR